MGRKQHLELEYIIANFCAPLPKIGIELEFYLTKQNSQIDKNDPLIDHFIFSLDTDPSLKNVAILQIEKEQGAGQIEVKTSPYIKINDLCEGILLIKSTSNKLAINLGLEANFKSQPFINDCGSALQINLGLEDSILKYGVGGILQSINQMMHFFAPNPEDYLRYDKEINLKLFKNKKYPAPTNISWGYDNRTAAIRVIKKPSNRVEFRIPPANCNPYIAISKLLEAVNKGIKNKIEPPEPIYGNAFDEKYSLESILNPNLSLKTVIYAIISCNIWIDKKIHAPLGALEFFSQTICTMI